MQNGKNSSNQSDLSVGLIYVAENKINGKRYVGKTMDTIDKRWKKHIESSKKPKTYLHKAISKYGSENFVTYIVDRVVGEDPIEVDKKLSLLEIEWISKLKTFGGGYNLTTGGDGTFGHKVSDDLKEKLRKMHIGTKHSDETKRKMKELNTGRKHTNETKKKISKSNKGKLVSDETRKKQSESQIKRFSTGYRIPNSEDSIKARMKPVVMIRDGVETEYSSAKDAQNATGIFSGNISRVCLGKRKTAGGVEWKYGKSLRTV